MTKQLVSVEFHVITAGYLWWPYALATEEVHETFTPTHRPFTRVWTCLEDAFEIMTLSGNFRGMPKVVSCMMKVTWRKGDDLIVRWCELHKCKATADYWADDEMMLEVLEG